MTSGLVIGSICLLVVFGIASFFHALASPDEGARFVTAKELRKKGLTRNPQIILGKTETGEFFGIGHEGNVMVTAHPGAGKTAGFVIPNALSYTGSILITDLDGEIAPTVARHRRDVLQQRVFTIDPSDPATDGIDVLSFIRPENLQSDCELVARILVPDRPDSDSKFWCESARSIVSSFLGHLMTAPDTALPPPRSEGMPRRHLGILADWLSARGMVLEGILLALSRSPYAFVASEAENYRQVITSAGPQMSGVMTEVSNAIRFLKREGTVAALSRGNIDLKKFSVEPTTIFLRMRKLDLPGNEGFLRLVSTFTMEAARRTQEHWMKHREGGPPGKSLLLLDEFANLGACGDIVRGLSDLRKYRMQVMLIAQSLGQLDRLYGESGVKEIMGASRSKVFFGGGSHDTGEYVEKMLGKRLNVVVQKTKSTGFSRTAGGSQTPIREWLPLLSADEFMGLDPEVEIVHIQSIGAVKALRISYYSDSPFKMQADPNPYYPTTTGTAANPG